MKRVDIYECYFFHGKTLFCFGFYINFALASRFHFDSTTIIHIFSKQDLTQKQGTHFQR